jgi:hypothetical protein
VGRGVRISIGSDAHAADQLDAIELGLAAACRAGVAADRIVNFLPANALIDSAARVRGRRRDCRSVARMLAPERMARKYGKKASAKVRKAMHERKRGTLKSGRSGRRVKSRKQAIAIGLSKARRSGAKVPPRKKGSSRRRKS